MRSSDPSTSNIEANLYIDWPIIIPKWPVDYLMDPIHYTKIADKLMQFRGKLPKDYHINDELAKAMVDNMKDLIEHMLNELDTLARMDDQGWIK